MSRQQTRQRAEPGQCLSGDWVLASSVPEWSTSQLFQMFKPPGQASEGWAFRGSYFIDAAGEAVAIWRREVAS
jgi:hypothetical protein